MRDENELATRYCITNLISEVKKDNRQQRGTKERRESKIERKRKLKIDIKKKEEDDYNSKGLCVVK